MKNQTETANAPAEAQTEIINLPTKENAMVEIIPFGTTDRIRLSAAIVRQMIAQPTRTGKLPDDNQCIKFIMLCKARHLNPFEGDAFMLGYDTQSGAQFSLITAHQVFLKRAEASKGFNGMESGVIVKGKEGGILEREGDLVYDDEKLIGGWAKVYRKDREKPFYRRLKLSTFNTGRSRWEKDPAGMIVKCSEADSLRTAFPTHLGGLYVEEELPPIDVSGGEIPINRPRIQRLNDPQGRLQAPSGSGSETTSGEPSVVTGEGEPTGSSSEAPSVAPSKRKLKKKAQPEPESEVAKVGDNESQMIMRLAGMDRTKEQLVQVAKQFDALKDEQGWQDIGEEGFAELLFVDNWRLIEESLREQGNH